MTATGSVLGGTQVGIPDIGDVSVSTSRFIGSGTVQGTIMDVDVKVGIIHSWVGDLSIIVESPTGTQVTLLDASSGCGNADDIDAIFDDEAVMAAFCSGGVPTINGTFQVSNGDGSVLADFDGENASGDWSLLVDDAAGGSTGFIQGFSVDMW